MLINRLFAATILIGLLVGALCGDLYWLEDSLLLHLFFFAAAWLSFAEFWPLCRAAHNQTFSHWGTLSGLLLVIAHYLAMHFSVIVYAQKDLSVTKALESQQRCQDLLNCAMVVAVLGAFWLAARRPNYEAALGALGVTCLGLVYIYFLPAFVLKIRHLGQNGLINGPNWNHFGTKMVIATIVIAKGCDVFAYMIGRLAGRHKAFPRLSPGKTIEGVVAGLLGSLGLAFLLRTSFLDTLPAAQFSPMATVIFGLCIGFSGMMGDLGESLLKRSAGVKDAGQTLPGYGGVLDVIDSLTVAGPVAYFLIPVIV